MNNERADVDRGVQGSHRQRALIGPAVTLGFALGFLCACDKDLPRPRYIQQKTSALASVGYPPPPARVEFIPQKPRADAVWLDGEWMWSGSKWAWLSGRWVVAPKGASFAPWTTVRDEQGIVYFANGAWQDATGRLLPAPMPLVLGAAMPGHVTSPEGDDQKTAASPIAPASATAAPPTSVHP
jgi:hypothetical protein